MSLINSMMETLIIMNKTKTSDGEGGTITAWTDGAEVDGAVILNSSTTAKIAEANGFTNLYTVTTKKNVLLDKFEVIKRKSDGKIFRITSDGADNQSPSASTLNIRQYSAEEWRLT